MGVREQSSSEAARSSTALASALGKLHGLIQRLSDDQYTRAGMKGFSSPIASHVRHCVDHVDALLLGLQDGEPVREIRYDRRERGTRIEADRGYALETCSNRREQVLALDPSALADPVRVLAMVSPEHPEQLFDSTRTFSANRRCSRTLSMAVPRRSGHTTGHARALDCRTARLRNSTRHVQVPPQPATRPEHFLDRTRLTAASEQSPEEKSWPTTPSPGLRPFLCNRSASSSIARAADTRGLCHASTSCSNRRAEGSD